MAGFQREAGKYRKNGVFSIKIFIWCKLNFPSSEDRNELCVTLRSAFKRNSSERTVYWCISWAVACWDHCLNVVYQNVSA